MQKTISSKKVALVFGILVICFSVGFYIFAWTGPTASPPDNNTSAPINVGAEAQTKQGNLTIGTATIKGDGSISTNLNSDKVDDLHAADLMAGSGGAEIYYVKMTSNAYNGNLGGFTGANNKCAAEYSGYRMCYLAEIPKGPPISTIGSRIYAIDFSTVTFDHAAWHQPDLSGGAGGDNSLFTCNNYTSTSGDSYRWGLYTAALRDVISYRSAYDLPACHIQSRIWCCPL